MVNEAEKKSTLVSGLQTFDFADNMASAYVCDVNTGICGPADQEVNIDNDKLTKEEK